MLQDTLQGRTLATRLRPIPAARVEAAAILLFLLASALFLFVDFAPLPIALWDESRTIVNALEMHRSGIGLVTTYGFEPDLWNTKPPLLIWLMAGSVSLFGPSEWALRLPSAVAAMGTLLLVLLFTRRVTGSLGTALLAAALLVLSPGFYSDHGARTGDYEALLAFLSFAYLALLFRAVTRERPSAPLLLLIGLLIAAAVMTKAVAGLLPGTGVALFLLLTRRIDRLWRTPNYLLMAAAAAAPVLLFYAAREVAAPGYLAAALDNDLLGRFTRPLVERDEPLWFYLVDALQGWFFAGPLLVVAAIGVTHVHGRHRLLLVYCLCIALGLLGVLSLSSTKLTHYLLPAYPPLAIAAALLLRGLARRLLVAFSRPGERVALAAAASVALLLLGTRAVQWRYDGMAERHRTEPGRYGALFARLADLGITEATVVDPGFHLLDWPNYAPILRSYRLLWAERGLATARVHAVPPAGARGVVVTCHLRTLPAVLANGRDLAGVEGCAAIRTPA